MKNNESEPDIRQRFMESLSIDDVNGDPRTHASIANLQTRPDCAEMIGVISGIEPPSDSSIAKEEAKQARLVLVRLGLTEFT
jgi:hypothetical protein